MEATNLTKTSQNIFDSYETTCVQKLLTETRKIFIPGHSESITICQKSIMDFYQSLVEWEISRGNPEPYIDERLWKSEHLMDKTIPGFYKEFLSSIYRFNLAGLTINNENIIDQAVKTGAIRIYNNLEAHCIIFEIVGLGEADSPETVLSVYFQSGTTIFRLHVCRRENKRLCIYVFENNPKGELCVGSGVCF